MLHASLIGLVPRVFASDLADRGSISIRVIPKTQKWYLMPPCLTLSIINCNITNKCFILHRNTHECNNSWNILTDYLNHMFKQKRSINVIQTLCCEQIRHHPSRRFSFIISIYQSICLCLSLSLCKREIACVYTCESMRVYVRNSLRVFVCICKNEEGVVTRDVFVCLRARASQRVCVCVCVCVCVRALTDLNFLCQGVLVVKWLKWRTVES